MTGRRRQWWNSFGFESQFKRRQLARVLSFALAYVVISSVCMAVVYATVLGPLSRAEMPLTLKLDILRDTGGIPGLSEMILMWVTLMTSLSLVFALGVGLHYSHKLAGPLYRFKLELGRVANGEQARAVQLRKGDDDFSELADSLNAAVSRIQTDGENARQQLEAAEGRLSQLCESVLSQLDDPMALRGSVEKASQPD